MALATPEHLGHPLLCPNRPPWRDRCLCIVCRTAPDPRPQVQLTRAGELAVRLRPESP